MPLLQSAVTLILFTAIFAALLIVEGVMALGRGLRWVCCAVWLWALDWLDEGLILAALLLMPDVSKEIKEWEE